MLHLFFTFLIHEYVRSSFPKNEVARKKWFDILGSDHKGIVSMVSDLRLCDRHFAPESIHRPLKTGRRTLLKRGALPIWCISNTSRCDLSTYVHCLIFVTYTSYCNTQLTKFTYIFTDCVLIIRKIELFGTEGKTVENYYGAKNKSKIVYVRKFFHSKFAVHK